VFATGAARQVSDMARVRNSGVLALALKYFARAHVAVYQRTDGRVGAKLLWFPAALVTTVGHSSGRPRTTPTLYLRDGGRVVLPASFVGRNQHPMWYRNLKSNPKVHIQIRGEHLDLIARDASDDERKRYWPRLIKIYPPYRGYRQAADRVIPLVVCE
jgi:deazaflavin-dependent oxidoreductase (nitroreductase family)